MNDILQSSLWGIGRGIFVHTLIYPLEVIKVRRQVSEKGSYQIATHLFKSEGVGAFYKGLAPQLIKTSIKQAWVWPMITEIPAFLERKEISPLPAQALTGFCIASVDACITTPLEKAKIVSILSVKKAFSLRERWKGIDTHWAKLSVNWISFLVTQKYLRDQAEQKGELKLSQLVQIGVKVALVVSLISAPFDRANTLKLSGRVFSASHYRGWPLSFLALLIHNVASVVVIDQLRQ